MVKKRSTAKGNYERALWLDAQIRDGGYPSVRSLAEQFEITERTAHRDVVFLKDNLGAPIEYDYQKKGYFYTEPNYHLPTVFMSQGELLAICLAKNLLEQYRESPFQNALHTAFEKICRALPDSVSVDLDSLQSAITFEVSPARELDAAIYDTLLQAIHSRNRLWMRYYTASRNENTERKVDPYLLFNHQNDWYLIAFDHLRQEVRDFALSRIKANRMLDENFEIPDSFDLEAYQRNHFGGFRSKTPIPITLLFDDYQARWIREREWKGETGREEHEDGALTLHLTVYDLDAAMRWVMQYGSHVQVLQPQELLEKITNEATGMTRLYQEGITPNHHKEGETS
jgi:predicted DNA-binding transcriptional regulator YafY